VGIQAITPGTVDKTLTEAIRQRWTAKRAAQNTAELKKAAAGLRRKGEQAKKFHCESGVEEVG
jgi:hypothetical protein